MSTPDQTPTPCEQFRQTLAEALENSPIHESSLRSHPDSCPDCRDFRAHMMVLDRLGEAAGSRMPRGSDETRERLHASWQHLAVRRTWKDWAHYWFFYELEPKVLQPLLPHAAMIFGFIFFSWSMVQLQASTGWLTLSPAPAGHPIATAPLHGEGIEIREIAKNAKEIEGVQIG